MRRPQAPCPVPPGELPLPLHTGASQKRRLGFISVLLLLLLWQIFLYFHCLGVGMGLAPCNTSTAHLPRPTAPYTPGVSLRGGHAYQHYSTVLRRRRRREEEGL